MYTTVNPEVGRRPPLPLSDTDVTHGEREEQEKITSLVLFYLRILLLSFSARIKQISSILRVNRRYLMVSI